MNLAEIRKTILGRTDLPTKSVKAFGMDLFVRTMTGTERDDYEQKYLESKEKGAKPNIRGALVCATLCDASGKRIFEDKDAEAVGQLGAKDLDRVFSVASELNGIGKDDVAELEGNS